MQFAVHGGTGRLDISDIKDLTISPAGKAGAEDLAHHRVRAVAAGYERCLAVLFLPTGSAEAGGDASALIGEAHQLGASLHSNAELLQPLDQQPLVLVLREDLQEGIGGQIFADGLKGKSCRRLALHPQIDRRHLVAMLHHKVGKVELAVEFEGTCLNRERARGRAGLRRFVDDTHLDAEPGEPERQDEPGRAGADDQNISVQHFILHLEAAVSRDWPAAAAGHADRRSAPGLLFWPASAAMSSCAFEKRQRRETGSKKAAKLSRSSAPGHCRSPSDREIAVESTVISADASFGRRMRKYPPARDIGDDPR